MLDYVPDTVQVKCAGLSDEQARRAPLPGSPLTTISSLVSHLRWVEYYWIRVVLLASRTGPRSPRTTLTRRCGSGCTSRWPGCWPSTGPAAASSASWSRRLTLTQSPGQLSWRNEPVTLRWVLMHLIEETARHNGHIDLLREMADGLTER